MGFFDFIKKKIVQANYPEENDNHKKNDTIKKTYINLLEKYTVKFFQMLGLENKVQLTYNIKDIFFVFVS